MIYIIMGKSASGKDHIYGELIKDKSLMLKPIVIYTTRPKRSGEENGREYFFTDEEHLKELRDAGKIIEERVYYPAGYGAWYYFTADEGQIQPEKYTYLNIGTLESYVKIRDYFGQENVKPVYIEVDDDKRIIRSVEREKMQKNPNYKEICRRFLADEEDFSEENLINAGIEKRFCNNEDISVCIKKIRDFICVGK